MSNLRLRAIFLLLLSISQCGHTFRNAQIKDKGVVFSLMATSHHNDTGMDTRSATSNGIESADGDYLKTPEDKSSTAQFNYLSALQVLSAIPILTVDAFPEWSKDIATNQRAHIKGFGEGMDIQLCSNQALERLKPFKLLIWDGDGYDKSGFTALLPMFLSANPASRVVAFKEAQEIMEFLEYYKQVAEAHPGRLAVVAVDAEKDAARFPQLADEIKRVPKQLPDWARTYFTLGRFAILMSGAKYVLSLGGGGVAAHEAEACWHAGMKEGSYVQWDVFVLSRGMKERFPSLIDWAVAHKRPHVKLLTGYDPNAALARCDCDRK